MQLTLSDNIYQPWAVLRRVFKHYKLAWQGKHDRPRVERLVPKIHHRIVGDDIAHAELADTYQEYVISVSDPIMAMSLQLAIFMRELCNSIQPRRILDLGSGFSSYVFRRYASDAVSQPEVWSIDDNEWWLEKTRLFLDSHGLPISNLLTWDEFIADEQGLFDVILHDLGDIEFRAKVFEDVIGLSEPGGFVILDDTHKSRYRNPALLKLRRLTSFDSYNLQAYTLDEMGRWAMLLHHNYKDEHRYAGLEY